MDNPGLTKMSSIETFQLERDAQGTLVLVDRDGCRTVGIQPVRAFPISEPAGVVVLCDADGHELLCVDDMRLLPAEIRNLLEDELAHLEFMPIVTRIDRVFADSDPSEWHIETDRGRTTFLMNDGDNDVRRLGPYRVLLFDTHGIRYLIPDIRKLDTASRRILDRYV